MSLPDGPLLVAVEQMRLMLAATYWWRRIKDESNPWDDAEALAHTHIDAIEPKSNGSDRTAEELSELRPFALFWQAEGDGYELNTRTVGSCCTQPHGHVVCQIEMDVPESMSNNDSELGQHVLKTIGRLILTQDSEKPGLMDLNGQGYPFIRRFLNGTYMRSHPEERVNLGDFVLFEFDLYWGIN